MTRGHSGQFNETHCDSREDPNPSETKSMKSWIRNVRIDFRTLFLILYKILFGSFSVPSLPQQWTDFESWVD